jgi:hypothetical protein
LAGRLAHREGRRCFGLPQALLQQMDQELDIHLDAGTFELSPTDPPLAPEQSRVVGPDANVLDP